MNLHGKGIEVGVATGGFSEHMLKYSNLSLFVSVDMWEELPNRIYKDTNARTKTEQDARYRYVQKRLSKYKQRSKVLKCSSIEASQLFKPCMFDFIYIDANHKYEFIKQDINLWWPKLKRGGLIAGHDYLDGILPQGNFGVKKAVDQFVEQNQLKLYITKSDQFPTWYVVKNKDCC